MYETPVDSKEDLDARIVAADSDLAEIASVHESVRLRYTKGTKSDLKCTVTTLCNFCG